jgi:hypothetical protein
MKLTQLAAKPQLVEIKLEDPETIKEYGEPVSFYIYDRQPFDQYVKMASANVDDFGALIKIAKELILDENGQPILADGMTLPPKILTLVIGQVVQTLGK